MNPGGHRQSIGILDRSTKFRCCMVWSSQLFSVRKVGTGDDVAGALLSNDDSMVDSGVENSAGSVASNTATTARICNVRLIFMVGDDGHGKHIYRNFCVHLVILNFPLRFVIARFAFQTSTVLSKCSDLAGTQSKQ